MDGSTKEQWTLSNDTHSATQTGLLQARACSFTDSTGKQHTIADASCLRGTPWFAPWMGFQLLGSKLLTATDITSGTISPSGLETIQFAPQINTPSTAPTPTAKAKTALAKLQQAAATSIEYDLKTGLASAIDFTYQVDSDPSHGIVYRTVFSDYRLESGLIVPHHIERYLQRTLQADITITSVTAE